MFTETFFRQLVGNCAGRPTTFIRADKDLTQSVAYAVYVSAHFFGRSAFAFIEHIYNSARVDGKVWGIENAFILQCLIVSGTFKKIVGSPGDNPRPYLWNADVIEHGAHGTGRDNIHWQ